MGRTEMVSDLAHPMQPIGWDGDVIRFKRNAIVRALLDQCTAHGSLDLNRISMMVATGAFSVEDQIQLVQLIGYSVSGFGELSYVPDDLVETADAVAADLIAGVERVK